MEVKMGQPLKLALSESQRQELEAVRDKDPRAYMRERAAALLKIASGESGLQVAQHGLLKRRDPDSIYRWIHWYEAEGIAGLKVRAGRGRKSGFSPRVPG
jgi:transposase